MVSFCETVTSQRETAERTREDDTVADRDQSIGATLASRLPIKPGTV